VKQKNKQDVLISRYKKLKESTLLSDTECDKHNFYIALAVFRTRFRKPSLQIKENKGKMPLVIFYNTVHKTIVF